MTYYKAIHPDGTDFYTGTVQWAPRSGLAQSGSVVRHPWSRYVGPYADSYLSVSTVATDCTGMGWPCRLLEVEPVDESGHVIEPVTPEPYDLPNKRAAVRWRVVRELPAHEALGPQGEQIVSLLERAGRLTDAEASDLAMQHSATPDSAVWSRALNAACAGDRRAAWYVMVYDIRISVSPAVRLVAYALVVRDLIGQHDFTQAHYDWLTGPWRRIIGPVHPDDDEDMLY